MQLRCIYVFKFNVIIVVSHDLDTRGENRMV